MKTPISNNDTLEEEEEPESVYKKPTIFSPSSEYSETSSDEEDKEQTLEVD